MSKVELLSEVTGSVWKVLVEPGQKVEEDEPVLLIESMKMEIPVIATESGIIHSILVQEGAAVAEGDVVVTLDAQAI